MLKSFICVRGQVFAVIERFRGIGTQHLALFRAVVFAVAFILNGTVLSPGFVKNQVNRIDVSGLTRDIADQQIQNYLPPELGFLKNAVYSAISDQEPWFKTQADQAIDSGYAFFSGKSDTISINVPLSTLKTDLQASLWKEFGVQISQWAKGNNIQTQLEPYIFQNLSQYRNLLPADVSSLPDAQLKSYIDTYLMQVQAQLNTPLGNIALSGLLQTLVKPYFDHYYSQYAAQIPDSLSIDRSNIPLDVMDDLLLAREYIGIFRTAYYWLIVLMVVLAAGIFLIFRNIEQPSRSLGIDLAFFGALDLAGVLIARSLNPAIRLLDSLPQHFPSLYPWVTAFFYDVLNRALIFSIIVLAVGIVLIVISFIFRKEAEI